MLDPGKLRPRSLKSSPELRKALVLFAIVCAAGCSFFGANMAVQTLPKWLDWDRLRAAGLPTEAEVVGKQIESGEDQRYLVEYRYAVPLTSGEMLTLTGVEQVGSDLYHYVEVSSALDIVYLPGDPEVVAIRGHHYLRNFDTSATCWMAAGALLSFLSLILLLRPQHALAQRRSLIAVMAGCFALLVVTLIGWVAELVLGSLGLGVFLVSGGVIPLLIGCLTGIVVARYAWTILGRPG